MPLHTITGPLFRFSDFFWASTDWLIAHPLAFVLVMFAAIGVVAMLTSRAVERRDEAREDAQAKAKLAEEAFKRAHLQLVTKIVEVRGRRVL